MDIEIKQKYPRLKKYGWTGALAIAITACICWAIISSRHTKYDASDQTLLIEEVSEGEFTDFIRLTGKVESGQVVMVSALESGIVQKKWVEEGAMVREGEIILTLHNPLLRQQILDSEAQLAEKQNMLRDTEIAMEKEQLYVKKELLQLRTEMTRKQREAERNSRLFDEGLIAREDFISAQEDYKLAAESYSLLLNRLHQDSIYRGNQMAMMRESLNNMRENFTLVRQRATNLEVRASHSGQLGSLDVVLGQSINSGQQVGQINILDNYKLSVLIDEHYINRIVPGLKGVAARGGNSFEVEIGKVYPEVDKGQFKSDLFIKQLPHDKLRVGQTYPVDLRMGDDSHSILLPKGSFFQYTGGKWVYVMDPDGKTARKREIKVGRQNPKYYEILEGLEPGEKVITGSYKNFGDADQINLK